MDETTPDRKKTAALTHQAGPRAGFAVKRKAAWSFSGRAAIALNAALGTIGCQAMQLQQQNTPAMIQRGNTMLDRQRI